MKKSFNNLRLKELIRQNNLKLNWMLSLKYSNILKNKLDTNKLNNIDIINIYKQYITSLKSNNIPIKINKSFRVWNDLINIVKKKSKNNKKIKNTIYNLYYVSLIKTK